HHPHARRENSSGIFGRETGHWISAVNLNGDILAPIQNGFRRPFFVCNHAFLLTAINPGTYAIINSVSKIGSIVTLEFASDRGLSGWLIKASTNLNTFPIDETANSVITEIVPGVYRAVVNIPDASNAYFLRVERP
ncbi:MAG: hypothetical protein ACR2H1_13885, partial [Limisphaerales bacterium]